MFGGLGDVDIVMPEPAEVEAIHAAYSGLVRRANAAAGERLEDTPPDFPHVDCAALHIDAVLRRVGLRGLAAG